MYLKCERCERHLGESTRDLECVGSFKPAVFANVVIPGPKDAIMCPACKYYNIFIDIADVKLFNQGYKRPSGKAA